jgi:hypothetical protein
MHFILIVVSMSSSTWGMNDWVPAQLINQVDPERGPRSFLIMKFMFLVNSLLVPKCDFNSESLANLSLEYSISSKEHAK